jgi:hypothetical protein
LLPQHPRLVAVLAHLSFGLLPPEHGALEGGIGGLTFELLGLHGEVVELVDLLVDGTVAGGGALSEIDALAVMLGGREQRRIALGIVRYGLQRLAAAGGARR